MIFSLSFGSLTAPASAPRVVSSRSKIGGDGEGLFGVGLRCESLGGVVSLR
jgi:hypothetical protein